MREVTVERVTAAVREVLGRAGEERRAAAVYLFGSLARGTWREGSDVDLGVLFAREPEPTLEGWGFDLEGDVEKLLGVPVQLVALNRAPADLVHRVLRDGVLLMDTDRSARIRFEVAKRNEYFDLLPHLERYRSKIRVGTP